MTAIVYYSIVSLGDTRYERQWIRSIRSLRAHCKDLPVHLLVYNEGVGRELQREADKQNVAFHRAGSYKNSIAECLPGCEGILALYPALHKVLSLCRLDPGAARSILWLDCDTYFFRDVAHLLRKYQSHGFYAREEPWSGRSHHGYRSDYVDEQQLATICSQESCAPIPPYNTGVMLMSYDVARAIVASLREFLIFAARLLQGICANSELRRQCRSDLVEGINRGSARLALYGDPLPYPSSNWWIVEEVAMWLTLGRISGLSHDMFDRNDVRQNGECLDDAHPSPVLCHYFSQTEEQFLIGR